MSKQVTDHISTGKARIVDAPAKAPRHQVEVDRNFEIPTSFYATTVGCYLGFIAILAAAFGNPGLIIPMAIFAFFIVAGFGVPSIWTRLKGNDTRPQSVGQFEHKGIITATGRLTARDAAMQMLILPVLIVLWGCAIVTIAAFVT